MKKIKKTLLAILLFIIMPFIILFGGNYEYYDDLPKWIREWIEYIDS